MSDDAFTAEQLLETVRFLPPEMAEVLAGEDSFVQEMVLGMMRTCIAYWEDNGILLDPIQMAGVLNAFGICLVQTGKAMDTLMATIGGSDAVPHAG